MKAQKQIGGHAEDVRLGITQVLELFVQNKGLISECDFEEKKMLFQSDPLLVELFDCLNARYNSSFKTKEEMTKYIIRKCFKAVKGRICKQEGVGKKNATKVLIHKFFSEDFVSQIRDQMPNTASEDQIINSLLPFK